MLFGYDIHTDRLVPLFLLGLAYLVGRPVLVILEVLDHQDSLLLPLDQDLRGDRAAPYFL